MLVSAWIILPSFHDRELANTLIRAQGAAQAFEDAGVLGAIFSHPIERDDIADALRVFEEVRRPRASKVRQRTLEQKTMFALTEDGKQQERDENLRAGADFELFQWLWDYDAVQSGRRAWQRLLNERSKNRLDVRDEI